MFICPRCKGPMRCYATRHPGPTEIVRYRRCLAAGCTKRIRSVERVEVSTCNRPRETVSVEAS